MIKFDANGKFQLEWGAKGTEPGEFNLVHSVAVDATRRVFVADRSNNRIQIFDAQGKFLDQWQHIPQPAYLLIAADNKSLWVASNGADRIAKYDMKACCKPIGVCMARCRVGSRTFITSRSIRPAFFTSPMRSIIECRSLSRGRSGPEPTG